MGHTPNENLAELIGLPNLDEITDGRRLITLADIAERKAALPSNAGRRSELFTLYMNRADKKADPEA